MVRRISAQRLLRVVLITFSIGLLQIRSLLAQEQRVWEYSAEKIGSQVTGMASKNGALYVLAISNFGGHAAPTIEKLDENGTILWRQFLLSDPVMTNPLFYISTSSNIVCAAMVDPYDPRIVICKLDSTGRILKTVCDSVGSTVTVHQMIALSDGSFALLGTSGRSTIIARYDSSLTLQWMHSYNLFSDVFLHTPIMTEGKNSEIVILESFSDVLALVTFTSTGEFFRKHCMILKERMSS